MNSASDNDSTAWDGGAAFFGAITASVSHELNNMFAIVDQSGGLLLDLVQGASQIEAERVAAAASTMCRQAARGLEIVQRLNRLAHSADDHRVEFDVDEELDNLIALCHRLAELKRARLTLAPAADRSTLQGSAFYLQAAVFWAVRSALAAVQRDDEIVVSTGTRDDGVTVEIECPRVIDPHHPDMVTLEQLATHTGAGVALTSTGTGTLVQISFQSGHGGAPE